MVDWDLEKLTKGERLIVARRRAGEGQGQAARRHGISHTRYSRWERDLDDSAPNVLIGQLQPHERCLLLRRRVGYGQDRVAQEMGVCKEWLRQMEKGVGNCARLVQYWEDQKGA